jgi:hypothetical protein
MKIALRLTQVFLALTGLAFANVGVQALLDPKAVVAAVEMTLENASSMSTIRAVYGGMHLAFGLFCFYGAFRAQRPALGLLMLYAGGYVFGRVVSYVADGAPNAFVSQWLITETATLLIASTLYVAMSKKAQLAAQMV